LGDEADGRALVAEQVRVDDLHRHRAPERLLLRTVDAAHAPHAHQLEDHVAAGERGAEERIVVGPARQFPDREAAMRAELVALLPRVATLRADDLRHGADTNTDAARWTSRGSRLPLRWQRSPLRWRRGERCQRSGKREPRLVH